MSQEQHGIQLPSVQTPNVALPGKPAHPSPRPWKVTEGDVGFWVEDANGDVVADVLGLGVLEDEGEANARLIAESPVLLSLVNHIAQLIVSGAADDIRNWFKDYNASMNRVRGEA